MSEFNTADVSATRYAAAGVASLGEEGHMDQNSAEPCCAGAGVCQPGLRVPPCGTGLRDDDALAAAEREQAPCQRLAPGACPPTGD